MRKLLYLSLFLLFSTSCSSPMKNLTTVPEVDINKYAGKWYEIARLPNSFEKDLICVTAEYILRQDGKITVINTGLKESDEGKVSSIKGKAWVPDPSEPGRLKVQFFWPFASGYYIFHLDKENYQYALVGTPSRKYLWVLSRSKEMDGNLYLQMVEIAKQNGFETATLLKVKQQCP